MKNRIAWLRIFSMALAAFSQNGHGQTWNITGSGAWDVAGNWTPAVVPNSATSNVIFTTGITAPATITLPVTFSIQNMNITAPGFSYFLSGGGLNATPTAGNGITVTGTTSNTISSDLNCLAAYTITQGSTQPLTLSGAVSGSVTMSKAGTGELILSGSTANTISGLLTINAGQVTMSKSTGVAAYSGAITISGAASVLQLNASEQTSSSAALTISNATAVLNLNGQSTTAGTLSITTTGTYALNGTLNLSGTSATALQAPTAATSPTITGLVNMTGSSGSISKPTAGTFSLQNIGIYNGPHDFAVTGGTIDVSGIVNGNGTLTKSGTGILNFSGSSINTYTGGTTLSAGTVNLSRSSPGICIPGDVSITGATVVLNNGANQNQIANTANMTLSAGTFNMNSLGEEFSSLTMTGGTLTNNTGSGLTLNSTGTALTMRNVTIPGQVNLTGASGGSVVFDPANNGTATLTNVSLGSVARTFNVGDGIGPTDMTVTGVISGSGGLTKTGTGVLSFTSTSSNTYTGLTTVQAGTMLLSKTAPFLSIVGDLLISGGTVQKTVVNQISNTSNVLIDGGTLDLNTFADTINSLTFYRGTFTQGGAVLSLASTSTALTMRNTTIGGTINLTGASGGNVVFDSTNNGVAQISSINLGTVSRTFNIASGTSSSSKMTLQGSTGAGAAIIKEGTGILELTGTHTYTLATTQINNGTLLVNGTLTCPTIAVGSSGNIAGTGTIQGSTTINGALSPGNSIGTVNFIGPTTFNNTMTLNVEFDQSSADLANITGSLTIVPGASVALIPLASSYNAPISYTIVQTTGGVTGTFSNVINPLLLYNASLSYVGNNVLLNLAYAPFSQLKLTGNALAVANYLDQLNVPAGSDLAYVESVLRQLPTAADIQNALLQMQPSQLKGIALSQENNLFQIESYILQRTYRGCCPCPDIDRPSLWSAIGGNFYNQKPIEEEPSFRAKNLNLLVGFDDHLSKTVLLGAAAGYSATSIVWPHSVGTGDIQSGNLSVYASYNPEKFYISGLILGAYNAFSETRHIDFSSIDRTASGSFHGGEIVGNFQIGGIIGNASSLKAEPYASGQYLYMHMGSIQESGANSLNLYVLSSDYNLFRGQVGINFYHCTMTDLYKISPSAGVSYIREQRFSGEHYTAALTGYNSFFTVAGMKPNRDIFSPKGSLSILSHDNRISFTFEYEAEIGERYFSQDFMLEGRYVF